jgi:dTDP-4-dehydrorhamnose 3,5-epimerase-like enzyme
VFIENDVLLGDRVTVKCGVQLWDGISIGDDVFVGPNVTFTNDKYPRSKRYLDEPLRTRIGNGASLGANATVLPGVSVGMGALVGAGSVVTRDVPALAVVKGNPGRICGYVNPSTFLPDVVSDDRAAPSGAGAKGRRELVGGARLFPLPTFRDLRGTLSAAEFSKGFPFVPQRTFVVYDVPGSHVRGAHAHRVCEQVLLCVNGCVSIALDDGVRSTEITLDSPDLAVYIPPLVWSVQYKHSADAVLVVFASQAYDAQDYIRDYDLFRKAIGLRTIQSPTDEAPVP